MGGLTYKKVLKFIFITLLFICFNNIINGAPFSLALLPGLFFARISPLFLLLSFFTVSLFCFSLKQALLLFISAIFLCVVFCFYQKKRKQIRFEIILFLAIALLPYCFGLNDGFDLKKVVYSAVICLLAIVLLQGLNLVFVKKFNKKANKEQVVAYYVGSVCFLLGLINFFGIASVYLMVILTLLLFCYFYKDTRAYTVALIVSLPFAITTRQVSAIAIFIIYCAVALLFIKKSKLLSALSTIIVQTVFMLLTGGFSLDLSGIFFHFAPFSIFLFLPARFLNYCTATLKKFDEPEIIRDIINDERAELSAKLYHLSSVFQNLNSTVLNFNKLTLSQQDLINKMCDEVIFTVCAECNFHDKCYKKNKPDKSDILKLINIGINKGNINLIDLSRDFSSYCYSTNSIIFTINKLLDEYRLHLEKSTAVDKSKALITLQASGVSEVLKNMAFEFSERFEFNRKCELEIFDYFATNGIIIKQVLKVSNNYHVLYPKTKTDFAFTAKLLSAKLQKNMRIVSKTDVFGGILAIYSPAPFFDACFGVAQKTKQDSDASGDTHTLTKIDENTFIVALCDGMGSGETAFSNSQTAISLIEAFLKAKLSKNYCIDLTNKMISLCASDSFCALDLITFDLNIGQAEILKIGAPFGFLLTENSVKIIENNALPLGIMEEVSPTTYSVKLNDGDTFIMLSDGITDAFFSSTDTVDFLQREKCINPQTLAEKILNHALQLNEGEAKDDMSVVVVKIYKKEFLP